MLAKIFIGYDIQMAKQKSGILRVGTSGIVVPGNKQSFPPDFKLRSRLSYYSSLFDTLEVNSSFYKVPMPSTFEKWSNDVPDEFQFTLKLWRQITHIKELKFDLADIDFFLKAAEKIGKKKGCLLIQFPGKITMEYYNQVEQVLKRISEMTAQSNWRKAVEFRDKSWYGGETSELLDEHQASIVLHDIPKSRIFDLHTAAPFAYYRFHGPTGNYNGSYSNDYLLQQSKKIRELLYSGKDVYAYFNNTIGDAFNNASRLRELVKHKG